ncbi:MAG: hypothetical protein ABWY78_06360 [Microvirga sp.]
MTVSPWRKLTKTLGPLGKEVGFVRRFLGDENFLRLAEEFSAEEVIVACGVFSMADELGLKLRAPDTKREAKLLAGIRKARGEEE